jgi:hypothetical protein
MSNSEVIVISNSTYERKDLEFMAEVYIEAKKSGRKTDYWYNRKWIIEQAMKQKPDWNWPSEMR